MQPAPKKLKTDGAMTRDDWDFWENEVVHGAAGQVRVFLMRISNGRLQVCGMS